MPVTARKIEVTPGLTVRYSADWVAIVDAAPDPDQRSGEVLMSIDDIVPLVAALLRVRRAAKEKSE